VIGSLLRVFRAEPSVERRALSYLDARFGPQLRIRRIHISKGGHDEKLDDSDPRP
jgi:hypothetical protein